MRQREPNWRKTSTREAVYALVLYEHGGIITRNQAKAAHLTMYFLGRQCRNGHVAPHWVHNAYCCACEKLTRAKREPSYRPAKKLAPFGAALEKVREIPPPLRRHLTSDGKVKACGDWG
jgi:hypothetical protein